MKISVILCTYNRCETLARALDSVALSTLPESVDWEVLVVDNNSSDQTREVIEEFCRRHTGRFHYLFEGRQGLSHARNAGIRESQGDVLAFTDDDVTVEPTWLQNLTAHLHNGDWVGAGGRIRPDRTFLPPRWLSLEGQEALAPLTIFDRGPNACELTEPPFGANMAFKRNVFEKYGGFRVDLGRCGEGMLSNEDTEFSRRLLTAGERLRYEASAVVYHPVTENRLQKQYFLTWWFGKGRAEIRELGVSPDTKWRVAGIPFVQFRRLAVWTLRWMIAIEPARRFTNKIKVWASAGQIQECYRQAASTNKLSGAAGLACARVDAIANPPGFEELKRL